GRLRWARSGRGYAARFIGPLPTAPRLRGRSKKARGLLRPRAFEKNPAITYSRGRSHYHWPWMLNGRVRNGNGCGHPGKLTGIAAARRSAGTAAEYQLAATRVVSVRANVASAKSRHPFTYRRDGP